MARTYSAEGIILKRTNIGEADRLVTILSKGRGKFSAVAPGVRKVSSRKAPNLELLNQVKLGLARGKTFDVITEAVAVETFKSLKENLVKVGFGFYLVEITNEFLAPGQGGKGVFELLEKVLKLLDQEDGLGKIKLFTRAFEMKLLELLGFKPELDKCTRCGQALSPSINFLSPQAGGVVGRECRGDTLFARAISPRALAALRFLQKEDWEKIKRGTASPALNAVLEQNLHFYLEYLLEKEIKTAKFIDKLSSLKEGRPGA